MEFKEGQSPWTRAFIVCLCSNDEKYIIILDKEHGNIYYANSEDLVFHQSCIHCPVHDFNRN